MLTHFARHTRVVARRVVRRNAAAIASAHATNLEQVYRLLDAMTGQETVTASKDSGGQPELDGIFLAEFNRRSRRGWRLGREGDGTRVSGERPREGAGHRERGPKRRRATVAVLTAVTLVVLLIFASLAIDLGFVRAVCGDMQHTADAGALAAASALMQSDGKETEDAKDRAVDVIERMLKSQGVDALDDQIIEFGTWDYSTREFTPVSVASGTKPFAVRVVGVRNKTPLFFAGVMGKYSTNVTREAVALASGPCAGIWGLEGVKVTGSVLTNSYNSDDGPYSADTAGENGDICSGRNITVNGSVEVDGDVMCGFGYEVTTNGNPEITGLTTANTGPITAPTVDFGNIKSVNDDTLIGQTTAGKSPWKGAGWNLYINANDNLNVPPGKYYMDSITMHSGSTLTVTGPTTVYVGGNVAASGGGVINKTADPGDFSIIAAGTSFEIGGSYDFYGSVLAPNADVKLHGDSQFYGGVIGKTVTLLGNFEVHVDESLPLMSFMTPPQPSLVK
jgi:hypothetical protein